MVQEKFSVKGLADFWQVSKSSAWRIINSGGVPSHQIGKRVFVYRQDAEDYVKANTRVPFDPKEIANRILQGRS